MIGILTIDRDVDIAPLVYTEKNIKMQNLI